MSETMTTAPAPQPAGMMQDSQGRLVPLSQIKPQQLLEDELVRKLHARGDQARAVLQEVKTAALDEVRGFVELLAQQYGAKRGGQKGNITLSSFDGSLRVQVKMGDVLSFGPELQAAKALLDELLLEWSTGGNENIRVIVLDAFAVDKAGKVDTGRILGLRRLNIADERWKRAMEAIGDALRVTSTREYVHLQSRVEGAQQSYVTKPLDIAKL